jgi:hypothetical protein
MKTEFKCSQCNIDNVYESDFTTGYATNKDGNKICFSCCGVNDKQSLIDLKPGQKYILYYDGENITNWPGTLKIKPFYKTKGKHNFCGIRTDVYFSIGGKSFHGVQMGDFNQIIHINCHKKA